MSYSIWDYLGISILLGPLIITVLSLVAVFTYTAYDEYTSKPPITFLNHYSIPRNIIVQATTISLIITSAGLFLYQNASLIPPFFSITSTSEVTIDSEVKIGVYRDAEGKREAKNIEWGELTPLQVVNVTIFLVNEGTEVVYIDLAWNENSWRPEGASQYFSLGWDFSSRSLEPNMSRKVRLFLWVKPNVQDITTFSFDIIIKGSTEP